MSKITNNMAGKAALSVARSAKFFTPSPDQKRAKAIFWTRWEMGNSNMDATSISAAKAVQVCNLSAIEAWWSVSGFKDWFLNKASFHEDAELNAAMAMETLRELMVDTKPSIRLKAASEALKVKDAIDKKQQAADQIIDLDPAEIKKMIEQYQKLIGD